MQWISSNTTLTENRWTCRSANEDFHTERELWSRRHQIAHPTQSKHAHTRTRTYQLCFPVHVYYYAPRLGSTDSVPGALLKKKVYSSESSTSIWIWSYTVMLSEKWKLHTCAYHVLQKYQNEVKEGKSFFCSLKYQYIATMNHAIKKCSRR